MKLYTEEEVRKAISEARFLNQQVMPNESIIDRLSSIEIPTDENGNTLTYWGGLKEQSTNYTSIDWLIEKHFGKIQNCTPDFRMHIAEAQAIHRVEIIEAYAQGSNDRLKGFINADYYKETFEGGNK